MSTSWLTSWNTQSRRLGFGVPFNRPKVESLSCPRLRTASVFSPRRTEQTWATPNDSFTRATHDRIFFATTAASDTESVSPRQTSHAPHAGLSYAWPKYRTSDA